MDVNFVPRFLNEFDFFNWFQLEMLGGMYYVVGIEALL